MAANAAAASGAVDAFTLDLEFSYRPCVARLLSTLGGEVDPRLHIAFTLLSTHPASDCMCNGVVG